MNGKSQRIASAKASLGNYSTNNNWSMTFWVYMQLQGFAFTVLTYVWHFLTLSNNTNNQSLALRFSQRSVGQLISMSFSLQITPSSESIRYFQEYKWKKMVLEQSEGQVKAFFQDQPQYYSQIPSPFATNGQKVEEIQIAYIRRLPDRNRQSSFIYCKNLHLWNSKSLRQQHHNQINRLQDLSFNVYRDFGLNYPTEYLHDGWQLSPDFDFDTRMKSYSGTRDFSSTPDFSLQDSYAEAWKISSPMFGFQICDARAFMKYYDLTLSQCKRCPVDCKQCTVGNNCSRCDTTKQNHNGICLDLNSIITGATGQIQTTDFNLTDALKVAHQQLPKIQVSKIIFSYPDQSKQEILYKNPFKVPRYSQQTNGNPFTVNVQIILINDETSSTLTQQLAGLTQIEPTSIDASNPTAASEAINLLEKTIPSSDDIPQSVSQQCKCINGVCKDEKCVCNAGFSGHECKHTEQLRKQIQDKKDQITQNFINNPPADDSESIQTISDLVQQPTTLTTKSADVLLQKLSSITKTTTKALTNDEVKNVISSGVSIIRASDYNKQEEKSDKSQGTALIKKAMKTLQDISNSSFVQPTPGNPFVIEKKQFSLKVEEVDTTQEQVSIEAKTPNSKSDQKSSISIPSSQLNVGAGVKLKVSVLVLEENPFLDDKIRTQSVSTPLIDINIFAGGQKQTIIGKELQLKFPVTQRMLILMKQENASNFSCQYYNQDQQKWLSDGLKHAGTIDQIIKCSTTHLTSFSSFLKKSISVIKQSNYNVFLAFKTMTWSSLLKNVGFYFMMAYWGLFFILFILMYVVDKKRLKANFEIIAKNEIRKGTQALHAITQTTMGISIGQKNGKSRNNEKNHKNRFLEKKNSMESIKSSSSQDQQILQNDKNFDKTRNLNSVIISQRVDTDQNLIQEHKRRTSLKQVSYDEFKTVLNGLDQNGNYDDKSQKAELQLSDYDKKSTLDSKGSVVPIKVSKIKKIIYKLTSYTNTAQSKHCCVGFMAAIKGEISSNNIPINVVSTTSVLVPRTVRLTIFFLAILLEISMVALFFNLQPQNEEETSFLENFIENLWIGIYSVLLSAVPLLLVGCFLTYPSKYKKQLENALESQNFRSIFSQLKKKYRKILVAGYVMFFVFMIFLSLFVIAFSEKASTKLSKSWMESSFIGIILDQVVLELLAAITIGIIVVAQKMFKFCKCLIILAVFIEIYRLYRNLSD